MTTAEAPVTTPSSTPADAPTSNENTAPDGTPGLFSNAPEKAPEASPTVSEHEEWWLTEKIKGEGPPPDHFLKDKYGNMEEQAKSIHGLRKKLSSFTGAPEGDYEFTADQNLRDAGINELKVHEGFEKDMLTAFKEAGMNNEFVNKIANAHALFQHKTLEQDKLLLSDYDKGQRELLTKNKIDIDVVATYLRNQGDPDVADAFIKQNTMDALTIMMFDSLRQNNTYKQPDAANPAPQHQFNAADLRAELKESTDSGDIDKMNAIKDKYIKCFGNS